MFDYINEELDVSKNKVTSNCVEKSSLNNLEIELNDLNVDEKESNNRDHFKLPPAHTTLSQWLAGGHSGTNCINEEEGEDKSENNEISNTNFGQNNTLSESKSKKRRGSNEIASNDLIKLTTAKKARAGWTLDDAQSVSIGELYLLFNCPNKIILEYTWEQIEENSEVPSGRNVTENDKTDEIGESKIAENLELSNIEELKTINSKESLPRMTALSTLQKLLIAANITLTNLKRPATNPINSQSASLSSTRDPLTSPSGVQSNKPIRKKASRKKNPPDNLLSNVIRDTIFSDPPLTPIENSNANEEVIINQCKDSFATTASVEMEKEKDQFVTPKLPAPRSNQSQGLKSSSKMVRNNPDPTEVEQVLNKLSNSQKYRRARRPLPKPFLYNFQKKMVKGTHSAILVIPASHIASAEGKHMKSNFFL